MAADALSEHLRPATGADAPAVARLAVAGFETWRRFAPSGWSPPAPAEELHAVRSTLAEPTVWARLVEDEHGLAGHVIWLAACATRWPTDEAGLAHLWQIFLRQDLWGSGLATVLHDAALAAAARAGYATIRLNTAAGHARGRRFYEREGWVPDGEPFDDEAFGMTLVWYRRALRQTDLSQ